MAKGHGPSINGFPAKLNDSRFGHHLGSASMADQSCNWLPDNTRLRTCRRGDSSDWGRPISRMSLQDRTSRCRLYDGQPIRGVWQGTAYDTNPDSAEAVLGQSASMLVSKFSDWMLARGVEGLAPANEARRLYPNSTTFSPGMKDATTLNSSQVMSVSLSCSSTMCVNVAVEG